MSEQLRLSYAQLGQRLGKTSEAARRLAARRGWQRVEGNDGKVYVLVDEVALLSGRPGERPPAQAPGHPNTRPDTATELAAAKARAQELEVTVGRLEERLAAQETVIADLRQSVAWHRRPWWRRWRG